MQTFFKHEGAFFYINIVSNEYGVNNDYLELYDVPIDSNTPKIINGYQFSSKKERDAFKENLLNELRKIPQLDD